MVECVQFQEARNSRQEWNNTGKERRPDAWALMCGMQTVFVTEEEQSCLDVDTPWKDQAENRGCSKQNGVGSKKGSNVTLLTSFEHDFCS